MYPENSHEQISRFLSERIAAGDFPSAVYVIAQSGSVIFADALGDAVRNGNHHPARLDTIYDVASLTKPLVTGLLFARRIENKKLGLHDRAAEYLQEFDTDDKRQLTIGQLLTHTSGLPAWRPLYITSGGDRSRVVEAISREKLEFDPGSHVLYSDLGFIALALTLERLENSSLAELARSEIFEPLKLSRTFYNPSQAFRSETAACETGNEYERDMCARMGAEAYYGWRNEQIWGEVHDGNAHFLGGASGHAGLFSTARETYKLAQQFLAEETELLTKSTCALFQTNMTEGLEEARSFAWQLAATTDSTAGPDLPADSFGHTGFTGTSCWTDASRQRVFVLLTNRTHGRRFPFVNINGVRRRFHSLAVQALELT